MTRSRLQQVLHRLVGGARPASLYTDSTNFGGRFYQNDDACQEIARHRLVFLGEIHAQPSIIAFQEQVQTVMSENSTQLHVVLEHFSFEMQNLLREYQYGLIQFEELVELYKKVGTENHNIEAYRSFLEYAREHKNQVQLHAGFVPRSYARLLMREGKEAALLAASQWLPINPILDGTAFHYNVFESLLTGRSVTASEPSDQFRGIFQAQVLKDVAMANRIDQLLKKANENEKFLVIAGNGHVMHYCGVPERVLEKHPEIAAETCVVVSQSSIKDLDDENAVLQDVRDSFGPKGPGDYVYVFRDGNMEVKEETRSAYDKVGDSAHLEGNAKKAQAIMYALGYTYEQFKVAGPDAYNFQGVGNPHIHGNIQPGERVLDIGSGLGVDSFIASQQTGPRGKVTGIDISQKEVRHAQKRANDRELTNAEFIVADMEKIPFPDDSFDVVISNGAFCLAPNKEKAFAEILRVLKPGGRISVCTSTIKADNLEPGVNWPLCMRMFIPIGELKPLCERVGFVDVMVDDSDSSMTLDLPEELLNDSNPERNMVHVGSDEFEHLEKYDMNSICARVCVVARKPDDSPDQ